MRPGAPLLLCLAACSAPAPHPERRAPEPAPSQMQAGREQGNLAEAVTPASDDPKCADPSSVEPIVIAVGTTARTADDLAITYGGMEHDNFEGGRTDTIVRLTFQGVMDDGKLTPSAFTWRPSVMGRPSWAHLGSMPVCVRVSSPAADKVTVEVFRRSPK